jgi:molybdopterin converting factor small subunit
MKQLEVRYYAVLREQAGRGGERVSTSAATARDLYAELRESRGFTLPAPLLRVAVNEEFADWDTELRDGDQVVFIPPVAGG